MENPAPFLPHVFSKCRWLWCRRRWQPFYSSFSQHPLRKYQSAVLLFIYCLSLLYITLVSLWDALYLFKKKVANLQKASPLKERDMFFCLEDPLTFFSSHFVLPVPCGYDFAVVLLCFFIMHAVNSFLFIHFLIATLFCMETQFPVADKRRVSFLMIIISINWLLQLDYSPKKQVLQFFYLVDLMLMQHITCILVYYTVYPGNIIFDRTKGRKESSTCRIINWVCLGNTISPPVPEMMMGTLPLQSVINVIS